MDFPIDAAGWLTAGQYRYRCALGRSGIRADKCEGDGFGNKRQRNREAGQCLDADAVGRHGRTQRAGRTHEWQRLCKRRVSGFEQGVGSVFVTEWKNIAALIALHKRNDQPK